MTLSENYNSSRQKYGQELTDMMVKNGVPAKYLLSACRFYCENKCPLENLVLLFKEWNRYVLKEFPTLDVNQISFDDFRTYIYNAKLKQCLPNTIIATNNASLGRLDTVKDARNIPTNVGWCIKAKTKFNEYIKMGGELYAIYLPDEQFPYIFNIALVIGGEVIYYDSNNYKQIETPSDANRNEHQLFQNKLPSEIRQYLYNRAAIQGEKMEVQDKNQLKCNRSMNTNKKTIRLTEADLRNIIKDVLKETLTEF